MTRSSHYQPLSLKQRIAKASAHLALAAELNEQAKAANKTTAADCQRLRASIKAYRAALRGGAR